MPRIFAVSLNEAKDKWCPMGKPGPKCVADDCMAWRFVRTHVDDGDGGTKECGESHGFCGMAVDPTLIA